VAKRGLDVVLSAAGLAASLPLWGAIALAIKLNDSGPVFYRQCRVGKVCREFTVFKFRSMVADSDRRWGAVTACSDDQRATRVGRILRATAMDELPQLWNILRRDMSFVGPGAEWVELVKKFRQEIPAFDRRHVVRPGLTGLAQLYGHAEMPRRKKLRYDLFYARRASFWLDARLIFLSFLVTFAGKWELRQKKLPRWLARSRYAAPTKTRPLGPMYAHSSPEARRPHAPEAE
jgi:lipopolysaccharide/colanic/teichoic acid biosynthesis glycosyltransferase